MDHESRLRLERDAMAVRASLEASGGELVHRSSDPQEPDAPTDPPGLYWAVIRPTGVDTLPFTARILWTVYPDSPPSLLFVAEVGGPSSRSAAWPAAPGYRAPVDVCKPFTAEGQQLHPEWAAGPQAWRSEGNPFLYVVETLQSDIDRVRGARAA